MNETEKDRLLRLYKLLWEQIKNKVTSISFVEIIDNMMYSGNITMEEKITLYDDVLLKSNAARLSEQKAFVQRMIKELENEK